MLGLLLQRLGQPLAHALLALLRLAQQLRVPGGGKQRERALLGARREARAEAAASWPLVRSELAGGGSSLLT